MQVDFFDDASEFLAVAADFLAADPIRLSVIATNAVRGQVLPREAVDWPRWFATVSAEGVLCGVAMRTHPAETHPAWIGPMPPDAVTALGTALIDRGEAIAAMTGSLPEVADFAALMARAVGGQVEQQVPTRLWALSQVQWPAEPAGRLREATAADAATLLPLLLTFIPEAAAQAGRPVHPGERFTTTKQDIVDQIAAGRRYLLWEVDGRIAHVTGINVPAFGSARIGPVLTPEPFRGKGYAAWVVAVASQQILDAGLTPCLYTDVTNPVSNGVYARIGYEALGESGEYSVA